jgi:hypothetical protein
MGFQSNPQSKWIIVNSDAEACKRYNRLFGAKRVKTFSTTLHEFNRSFERSLRLAGI